MARVPVGALRLALALSFLAVAPKSAIAALPSGVTLNPEVAIPDLPDGKRSYAQAAFTKIRRGSNLSGPETVLPASYTPGRLGERRDALVRAHYAHMAQIDVLAEAALRAHDVGQAERAEALRRRDTQAFFFAMQALRRQLLEQQAGIGP